MTDMASFSLLDAPWVPCLLADGTVQELGLIETFERAPEVRDIVGEVPTQTFAIARLLLAILHRALGPDFRSVDEWSDLWQQGIPVAGVAEYLERHRERFDLLHPVTPFYQVADLHTAKNEVKSVVPLIVDVPSNNRLFTGRAGTALEGIGFAEAARWVVHAHAYDPSGIKSGMVGDDRVKGGRGYPIGTGWAGALGGILIEGKNLAETLLLNLVPVPEDLVSSDLPPWEREPDTAAARSDETVHGPIDLLTWQSRRIRLVRDGDRVVGCVLGNGDRIAPQNRFDKEFHSAWRYSKPQTQKSGQDTYMPREHLLGRAFWRGISGIVVHETPPPSSGPEPWKAPATVNWLLTLRAEDLLTREQPIAPRAFGIVYGSNQSVVSEIIDDRFMLPLAALDEAGQEELAGAAQRGVAAADLAARELMRLAGNLALAAGGSPDGPRERAGEAAYALLDRPFRTWLAELDPAVDGEAQLNAWRVEAKQLIVGLGEEYVARAGASAWVGRTVTIGGKNVLMKTNIAEQWFRFGLQRALAMLGDSPTPAAEEEEEV